MEFKKINPEGFAFRISPERIKFFSRLTPEERLKWLEEAHEFVKNAVPAEKIKRWKALIQKNFSLDLF